VTRTASSFSILADKGTYVGGYSHPGTPPPVAASRLKVTVRDRRLEAGRRRLAALGGHLLPEGELRGPPRTRREGRVRNLKGGAPADSRRRRPRASPGTPSPPWNCNLVQRPVAAALWPSSSSVAAVARPARRGRAPQMLSALRIVGQAGERIHEHRCVRA
jgi:hypothetical protein